MGKLSSLLRSKQIESWREQVSQSIDAAIAALGGGSSGGVLAELDIVETQRSGGNQTVSSGTDIVLQNTVFNQGAVAYDPATGIYTLAIGKVYELSAFLTFINYDSGGDLEVNWVQADTNAFLDESILSTYAPDDGTQSIASNPGPHAVYQPTTAAEARVKLRAVGGAAAAELQSFTSGAIIKQLR